MNARSEHVLLDPDPEAGARAGARMRRHSIVAICIALGLVVVMLAAILFRQGAFTRSATAYFVTESASGLTPGTVVRMSGFRIGAVSALRLEPDLSVMVTLKIPLVDFQRLRKDARVQLKKEDLVQTAVLELNPGRSAEALPAENPRLAFDPGRSLGQSAQDLTDRLAPILEDIKVLTAMLSDRDRGLAPMLEKSRAASSDLAAAAKEIRALSSEARARFAAVGAQAESTLAGASAAFSRFDQVAGKAEQSLGRLDDALPGMLVTINGTLEDFQAVAKDARAISTTATQTVPQTLRDIQPAAEDAREIFRGVKQSWPVRNMLPAK